MPADPISRISLLPPNASQLERAVEAAASRVDDVPVPLGELWDPGACPIELLPWLAWSLSTDNWDAAWSEATKRAAVANAIAEQRIKGTPAAVKAVLARFDQLLELVEWFEQSPSGDPYTFEIRLPLDGTGGVRATAAFAEAVIRDVTRVKNLRSHFVLVQQLRAGINFAIIAAAQVARFDRFDGVAAPDPHPRWLDYLQTEDGEPIQDETGALLEGASA